MIIKMASAFTYTDDKNEYWTDLISGIQNVPLGHFNEEVYNAITRVNNQGIINSYNIPNISRKKLEDNLKAEYPSLNWAICSTGTEAIERVFQLIKLKRKSNWSNRILYLPGAFHGKSYALAIARYSQWGCDLMQPLNEETLTQPFDAIIYEPVQGLSGFIPSENDLANLCKKHDAYLIADEMITGFGRCGPDFMSTKADYITCGKGISSGFPIAFIGSRVGIEEIPTGWTTTGAGNAMCCEVANATLTALKYQKHNVENYENILRNYFGDKVAGKGALLYIKTRNGVEAQQRLIKKRYIALYNENLIRLAPCLNFPEDEWNFVCNVLKNELEDLL